MKIILLYNNSDTCFCKQTIVIRENILNNQYEINFEYEYGIDEHSNQLNPFFNNPFFKDCSKKIKVPINVMTKTQINYLGMETSKLSKMIGSTDPRHYKKLILFQLCLFNLIKDSFEKENKDYFCRTVASVSEKIYDKFTKGDKLGMTYYYIDYKYEYGKNDKSKELNPFHSYFAEHIDGDIVVKNNLSQILINYLQADKETFSKKIPNINPKHYKRLIMYQLALIWD